MHSFWRIQSVELGFEPSRLLTAGLRLPGDRAQGASFLNEFLQRIERLPGVAAAAASAGAPMTAAGHNAFVIEGRPARPNDLWQDAILDPVTPGYFRTMGIALRSGRYLMIRRSRLMPSSARGWPAAISRTKIRSGGGSALTMAKHFGRLPESSPMCISRV